MGGNWKKNIQILIGIASVGVIGLIGYKAILPGVEAGPDVQTLCRYVAKSITNAQCTSAVAPDGFPAGNVVIVPESLDPFVPLAPALRELTETCWLDPHKVADIAKLLAPQPNGLTLPGFKADVRRKLMAGVELSLAESDNLTIAAGARSNDVQNISVVPRDARVLQLDQGRVESLLLRPARTRVLAFLFACPSTEAWTKSETFCPVVEAGSPAQSTRPCSGAANQSDPCEHGFRDCAPWQGSG